MSSLDPFDLQIARNLHRLRVRQRMSLEYLAKGLGLSYQQIQKYEKGRNRIAGSTLVRLAQTLEVPISEFFVGIDDVKAGSAPVDSELSCSLKRLEQIDPTGSRLLLELAEALVRNGRIGARVQRQ